MARAPISTVDYSKLGKPANTCCSCGVDLAGRERHPSIVPGETGRVALDLVIPPAGGGKVPNKGKKPSTNDANPLDVVMARRLDYCDDCWARLRAEGYFSFWLARRRQASVHRRLNVRTRRHRLLEMFNHLSAEWREMRSIPVAAAADGDAQPAQPNAADRRLLEVRFFTVAHMLLRLGAMRWLGEKTLRDGSSVLGFEVLPQGGKHEVPLIEPSDEEIERVRAELEELL